MSLSVVLFLFLAHLGVGIVFTLVFVSREAGVKFFRFNAGLAAILLAIALAFRYRRCGTPAPLPRVARCDALVASAEAAIARFLLGDRSAARSTSHSPGDRRRPRSSAGLVAVVAAGARRIGGRSAADRRRR